jgi:hypothetical protein
MLGEFFGMSAATALLLDLGPRKISTLSKILNNSLDQHRVTKFKKELEVLEVFLDKLEYSYTAPEVRKVLRKATLVRQGNVDKVKKVVKVDISEMTEDQRKLLALSLEKEAEDLAVSIGDTKTISSDNLVYTTTGARADLSPLALEILRSFKEKFHSSISVYRSRAIESSYKEATAFNRKVKDIFSWNPVALTYVVNNMLTSPGVDKVSLANQCIEWATTLESYFGEETSIEGAKSSAGYSSVKKGITLESYLLSLEDMSIVDRDMYDLSPERKDILDKSYPYFEHLDSKLNHLLRDTQIEESEIIELKSLMCHLYVLDNDIQTLNKLLFPDTNTSYSKEELDSAFKELSSVGFYLLHFKNTELLLNRVGELSYSKEVAMKISPFDREPNWYSFATVIDDIKNFCKSVAGSPIGRG